MPRTLILLISLACLLLPAGSSADDELDSGEMVRCPMLTEELLFVGMGHIATHDDLNEELLGSTIAGGIRRFVLQQDYDRVQAHLKSGAPLAQTVASMVETPGECILIDLIHTGFKSRWHSFDAAVEEAETIILGTVEDSIVGFHSSTPGHRVKIRVEEVLKGSEARPTVSYFSPGASFTLWETEFCSTINKSKFLPLKGSQVLLFYMSDRISKSCPLLVESTSMLVDLEDSSMGHRTYASGPGDDINHLSAETIRHLLRTNLD